MFGMDGAALTSSINSLMEDQPQGHETDQPLSTHAADEATTTGESLSNPIPDGKNGSDNGTTKKNDASGPGMNKSSWLAGGLALLALVSFL